MSAETPAAPGQNEHYLTVFRRNFRAWRGNRPFWAGLFILLGGFPIAYFPYAHLQVGHLTLAMATTAGAGSLIIGVLLGVLGISLWFQKHVRTFAGVAAILLALVSIPVANLGGFLMGFLLAMIGGAMAVAWVPGEPDTDPSASGYKNAGDSSKSLDAPNALNTPNTPDIANTPDSPAHEAAQPEAVNGVDEPNDLSGTSPANGANGRHSAG
ncbi:DUF6114 domain-containing protein [Streptomyces sp. NBC_01236]|uniref:DUF6114 domain-containing protein n=1 Tax=Streptomyces sp. NBC_01236 TaxID=2903789 RepID=UPI002E13BAA2|nr:DUF6114 domain-containing protein [Streptomyces sp. NBC_01236]